MGIKGLLPFLKKASIPVKLQDFKGFVAAIDTYCWIHKSSYACAMDLALGNPTDQYVRYAVRFLTLIINCDVKPILVFDGANLPSKSDTEAKRRHNKEIYRKKAAEHLLNGDKSAAMECFERSVTVTPEMAHNVMKAARNLGVDCIVAPYEADAQLAYLNRSGYADFVITEDSDLLLFGCKQVLFKLDMNGSGVLVTMTEGIGELCCGMRPNEFTESKFRFMGIMAGCDYFSGIPGIGLSTAAKILRQTRLLEFKELLSKLGMYTKLSSTAISGLTEEDGVKSKTKERNYSTKSGDRIGVSNKLHSMFIDAAIQAERTFRLQVIFDPNTRSQRRLSDPTHDDILDEKKRNVTPNGNIKDQEHNLFSYAGQIETDRKKALQLALGNIDCLSGKVVDDFDPDIKDKSLHRSHTSPSCYQSSLFQNSGIRLTSTTNSKDLVRLKTSIWDKNYPLRNVLLYSVNENTKPDYQDNVSTLTDSNCFGTTNETNHQSTLGKRLHISTSIQNDLQKFIRRPTSIDAKHQQQQQQQQQQRSPIFNHSKSYLEMNSEKDLLLGYKQETTMKTPKPAVKSLLSSSILSASPYFRSSQSDMIMSSSSSSESKEVADALFDAMCNPNQTKSTDHNQNISADDQTIPISDSGPNSPCVSPISESKSPTLNGLTVASVAFESKLSRFRNQATPNRNTGTSINRAPLRNIFRSKPLTDVTDPCVNNLFVPRSPTKMVNSVKTDGGTVIDRSSPVHLNASDSNEDGNTDLSPSFLRSHVSQSKFTFKRKNLESIDGNKPKTIKQRKTGTITNTGTGTLHSFFERWRFEAHAP